MVCLKKRTSIVLAVAMSLAVFIAGCKTTKKTTRKRVVRQQKQSVAVTPGDSSYTWQGFPQPARSPQESEILVEKVVPKTVRPTQKFPIVITVTNKANYKIDNVTVTEQKPDGVKFIKAIPTSLVSLSADKEPLRWELGTMLPHTKKKITIYGKPTRTGSIRYSGETILNFKVATDNNFSSTVNIIEPHLVFDLNMPGNAIVNTKIPVSMVFKNLGHAKVINAKMIHTLPPGLLTYEGKSKIELNIGTLGPNEKKSYKLNLKGVKIGNYESTLTAVANDGVTASAPMKVKITKPMLTIVGKAPKKRYVGKKTPYDITVKNIGGAPAANTIIELTLPQDVVLHRASDNGKATRKGIKWVFKSLAAGETKTVHAVTIVKKIMIAHVNATAIADHAPKVSTSMSTNVEGIAGLLTTLVDINDPVPLEEEVTYVITANNTGSLPSTGIRIKCEMEDSMEFVKTTGATKGDIQGSSITFEPLPVLNPNSVAKWRVVVKAVKDGDVRFTTTVESDQLDRPIELIESTHFYK
jgi:archaellum component FlaG (FlaF/FlaG flagellin family)